MQPMSAPESFLPSQRPTPNATQPTVAAQTTVVPQTPLVQQPLLLSVLAAEALPGETAYGPGFMTLLSGLTGATFAAGVGLIWVFGYTFWTLLEAMARAFRWERGQSLILPLLDKISGGGLSLGSAEGWPLDVGIVLGAMATWASLYFALDHLSFWGKNRVQATLGRKTARLAADAPPQRFFVEIRSLSRHAAPQRLVPDIGYLLFYPTHLTFIGEAQRIILPRTQIAGNLILRRSFAGLTGAYLTLDLAPPQGSLRLLARDNANTLSATEPDARNLQAALTVWLQETTAEG